MPVENIESAVNERAILARAPELFPHWRRYRNGEEVLNLEEVNRKLKSRYGGPGARSDYFSYDNWYSHPDGAVLTYIRGDGESWSYHFRMYFLNGQDPKTVWIPNQVEAEKQEGRIDPRNRNTITSFSTRKFPRGTRYHYELNGQEILTTDDSPCTQIQFTNQGVIIRKPDGSFSFNGEPLYVPGSEKPVSNPSYPKVEISGWNDGLIVQEDKGSEIKLVTSAKTSTLVRDRGLLGRVISWRPHPLGVVSETERGLYLNEGQLWSLGSREDYSWDWHPEGIILNKNGRLRFIEA